MKNFKKKGFKKSSVIALIVVSISLARQNPLMSMQPGNPNKNQEDAKLYALFLDSLSPQSCQESNQLFQEESYNEDSFFDDDLSDNSNNIELLKENVRECLKREDVKTVYQYLCNNNDIFFNDGLHLSALWLIVPSPDDTEEQCFYRKSIALNLIGDNRTLSTEGLAIIVLLLQNPSVKNLLGDTIDNHTLKRIHVEHTQRLNNTTNVSSDVSISDDSDNYDDAVDSCDLNTPTMHTPEQIQEFYKDRCIAATELGIASVALHDYVWTIAQPSSTQTTILFLYLEYQPKNNTEVESIRARISKAWFKDAVVSSDNKLLFFSTKENRTFSIRLFRGTEEL